MRVRFDKIDGFIKIHDKIRYLLFDYGYCGKICDKIKYLTTEKSGVTESINYYDFARIRTDSYDSLPIEKILTFYNVIILIKAVVNKNKNEYYYNIIFLDSTKLKIVWKEITTFFKRHISIIL